MTTTARQTLMDIRRKLRGAVAELALAKVALDNLLDHDDTQATSSHARLPEPRVRDHCSDGLRLDD